MIETLDLEDLQREEGYTESELLADICRESFSEFVKEFWEEVPGTGRLIWNWHLDVFCDELQTVAERVFRRESKAYDLVLNVSPGTSKSTLWSILFPAWCWTRMPCCRILTASHTDDLALDLANKSRWVIKSEKYRAFYPEIELREDSKGYFTNTQGGDRKTCTVGGKSPTGFHAHIIIIDDPIDPKKVLSEAELRSATDFMTVVVPTRKVDKAVTPTLLVMQRLGEGDPTDVMLSEAKKDGAAEVRHVCLPSDLDKGSDGAWLEGNVLPKELARRYVNGLMDPVRMPESVLREHRARGSLYFSTQFRQEPYAREGEMFQEQWFNKRVKAAPYDSIRIRYWDRAASQDSGCFTSGVLLAQDSESRFYIENVVSGQWGPDRRNGMMRAVALRDRAKYGPRHEPKIYVEAEGGSSGRDAWLGVARALIGFPVFEDKVTGDKVTRAEPWSAQCAAGNVFVVEDGTWDINSYVRNHCSFPTGKYKDDIDASSGAFNRLVKGKPRESLRVYSFKSKEKGFSLHLIACSEEELSSLIVDDHPSLLVVFRDPEEVMSSECTALPNMPLQSVQLYAANGGESSPQRSLPPHGLSKMLGHLFLDFVDIHPVDFQDKWNEPLLPWNLTPDKLVMSREQGKKLWSFLTKKYPQNPEVILFVDSGEGDRKALSVAYAVADMLRISRERGIHTPSDPDSKHTEDAPNKYLYDQVKSTRGMVI